MAKIMEMDRFETKDLYLSAYLKAKGLSLLDTRRDGSRVFFVFGDKEEAANLLKEFFNGGKVSVSLFVKAISDLKTLIYMK
jgi:hypothetical protein